jgi:hypothetical protein
MRLEHWFYTVPLRLRSLFRRGQVEAELNEELRYHLERQIEVNTAAGMSVEEARYAALRAMHGLDQRKEEFVEAPGLYGDRTPRTRSRNWSQHCNLQSS